MLIELNTENFDNETKTGLKLVEFYAPWCGYCQKQENELKYLDKVWIGQVNADDNPSLTNKYKISSFPTFLVFNKGKEVRRFSGYRQKEELMNILLDWL